MHYSIEVTALLNITIILVDSESQATISKRTYDEVVRPTQTRYAQPPAKNVINVKRECTKATDQFEAMNKVPNHIGIIPDGNRRWAVKRGLPKQAGYHAGLPPGLAFLRLCVKAGVKEVTAYGFTQDNTKRVADQRKSFQQACIDGVEIIKGEDVRFLVVGDTESSMFPKELLPYTTRTTFGKGSIKVNFLVNYGWQWDLKGLTRWTQEGTKNKPNVLTMLRSSDVSRIDLIVRWGGRRRLSGFLPVQSVYADFYVVDELWPDFKPEQFYEALEWYQKQDITLGG